MSKRILITLMGLILLSSISLAGYKIFEPKNIKELKKEKSEIYLNLSSIKEYTLSNGNNINLYYFFCSETDKNCVYIYDSVIPSIKGENNNIDINDVITYVDISENIQESKDLLNKLNEWGIKTFPAFVSCKVENNNIIINSVLEYDNNDPLNKNDIINWLKSNNSYYNFK